MSDSTVPRRFVDLARRPLRRLGIDVKRYQPHRWEPSRYELRRSRLMAEHDISVVLDVGACDGDYAFDLRRCGYVGTIVSFEPLAPPYEELRHRAESDGAWLTRKLALGAADGELEVNVAGNYASSSVLPMAPRHLEAAPQSAYSGRERVKVATLDQLAPEFVRPDDAVLLKLDVQGYEKQVLEGARQMLGQVRLIESELSLCTLYVGQPLLPEMILRIRDLGFQLIGLSDEFVDLGRDRVLQMNGLFERVRLADEIPHIAPSSAPAVIATDQGAMPS